MTQRISASGLLTVLMTSCAINAAAQPEIVAQPAISNFRPVDVSSDTLKVTLDYFYPGAAVAGGVWLHAAPEESGGVFDPRNVEFEQLPVRRGASTATLTITKRPTAADFTSVTVRACLSTVDRALVCRDFPYQKQWTNAVPPGGKPESTPPALSETTAWSQADLDRLNRTNQCPGCNLQEVSLVRASLSGGDLSEANLRKADFSFASLSRAVLNSANLQAANMRYATLDYASLQSALLMQANLRGAGMIHVLLQNARLRGADLTEANLSAAILTGADLRSTDLTKAHMENCTLIKADLTNATLTRAVLWSSNFSNAVLLKANLTAAYLQNARFSGADLRQTNLRFAKLENAILNHTNMEGADLTGADLAGARIVGARLSGAIWTNGKKCLAGSVAGCLQKP